MEKKADPYLKQLFYSVPSLVFRGERSLSFFVAVSAALRFEDFARAFPALNQATIRENYATE